MKLLQSLEQALGAGRVTPGKNISPYLTLRTKTTAEYYIEAETREDWIAIMKVAGELTIPLTILGGGSNYAIMREVVPGLTVRNLYREKKITRDTEDSVEMLVTSGYIVARLSKETVDEGLEGFEYHLGLPGTLGGAIYMNSKWTHSSPHSYVGDNLLKATLVDLKGSTKEVGHDYFQFAYDYSILQQTHEVVLDATFRLKKAETALLKQRAQETMEYRRKTQPHGVPTCGCFFRNISDEDKKRLGLATASAGYLIDQSGLKNAHVGGFVVSDIHANFIINKGDGKPDDLTALLTMIKQKVKQKFDVDLKEEVLVVK